MPESEYTSNAAPDTPEEETTSQAPPAEETQSTSPSVDPSELEEWRRRAEEARREAEKAQELARMAFVYSSNQATEPTTPSEPSLPDFDNIDLDDPGAIKRYVKEVAEAIAEQKVAAQTQQLVQAYSSNRAEELRRWAELNKTREAEKLKQAGLSDIIDEIEKQAKEWGIDPVAFAQPGQYESIAYYIIGKKEAERRLAEAARSPNLASSMGHHQPPPEEPPVDKNVLNYVSSKFGVPITEDDVRSWDFNEEGTVSIDDVFKEKK